MLKSYSVIRSFGHVLASSSSGWKSPSVFCTLMLLASCNGGGSSGGGGVAVENPAPISCPSGFIPVPHNSSVGTTKDFCVMKYEAKAYHSANQTIDADGCNEEACTTADWGLEDHIPASSPTGSPWRRINPINASAECNSLNALNGVSDKFDLISNPESMTIARNAEGEDANWETGTPGSGAMFRGHSDVHWSSPPSALAAAADSDPYNGTGNDPSQAMGSGKEQKRTLTLSNGEVIWDLSGNVWEWVDWETGGAFTTVLEEDKAFDGTDVAPVGDWREFTLLDQNINNGDVMNPLTWQSSNPALNSSHGIGLYFSGISGGAAIRGGNWSDGGAAGAFALAVSASTTAYVAAGFRCVYRP